MLANSSDFAAVSSVVFKPAGQCCFAVDWVGPMLDLFCGLVFFLSLVRSVLWVGFYPWSDLFRGLGSICGLIYSVGWFLSVVRSVPWVGFNLWVDLFCGLVFIHGQICSVGWVQSVGKVGFSTVSD